jgi:hypothetical protein
MSSNLIHVTNMVIVAELVKHLIVIQEIVGSNPTFHTKCPNGGIGRHSGLRPRGL